MLNIQTKRQAELLLVFMAMIEGFFPLIAHSAAKVFPPVFFTGLSSALAATLMGFALICTRRFSLPTTREFFFALGVAMFIVAAFVFVFIGAEKTSAINTALLLQCELFFGSVVSILLLREHWKPRQFLAALCVLAGTVIILFRGSLMLNTGELLIILATACFPIGNMFARKALETLSPEMLIFLRFFLGAIILLPLSWMTEGHAYPSLSWGREGVSLLVGYSLFILLLSKMLWYRALRVLPLGKATAIIMSYPAFSMLFAFFFFSEVPTMRQFAGFALTMLGIFALISTRPVPPLHEDLV